MAAAGGRSRPRPPRPAANPAFPPPRRNLPAAQNRPPLRDRGASGSERRREGRRAGFMRPSQPRKRPASLRMRAQRLDAPVTRPRAPANRRLFRPPQRRASGSLPLTTSTRGPSKAAGPASSVGAARGSAELARQRWRKSRGRNGGWKKTGWWLLVSGSPSSEVKPGRPRPAGGLGLPREEERMRRSGGRWASRSSQTLRVPVPGEAAPRRA